MKTLTIYLSYWSIRLFFIFLTLFLVVGSYFYTVPMISYGKYELTNPLYSEVKNMPTWFYDIIYFIYVFCIAIFIIFFMILYYNLNKRKKEKIDSQYIQFFISNLFNYIFSNEELTEEEKSIKLKVFKKELKNDHAKQLFINTLRRVHAQTTGIVRTKTDYLFKIINYDYLIRAYLHSPYLEHKLFALKVISDFRITKYNSYIIRIIKKNRDVLRSESLITLLNLDMDENLLFLVDLKIRLTMWDFNIILKTVKQLNKLNIAYSGLINSEIPEISALGISLARINKRVEFKDDIKLKIWNPNQLVNEEAFSALISFSTHKADYDFLIEKFEHASKHTQLKIIKALAYSPKTIELIKFLSWVVENRHFTQKVEAIRLLLDLDLSIISEYKHSDNYSIKQSCLQVLDFNI